MDKPPVRTPTAPTQSTYASSRNHRDAHTQEVPLPPVAEEGLVKWLHGVIHFAVRVLAILMTLVILWGVADVVYVIFQRVVAEPFLLLTASDILLVFGSFMVVLIAIEIFINITVYIKRDVLPIKMVIATALMAVARKVIMLDFKDVDWAHMIGIASIVLALGITYWLISHKPKTVQSEER